MQYGSLRHCFITLSIPLICIKQLCFGIQPLKKYLKFQTFLSAFLQERLCLAQISNTLLKEYSYNEIHNRRVALGITCVQCTPVQVGQSIHVTHKNHREVINIDGTYNPVGSMVFNHPITIHLHSLKVSISA